MADMHPALVKEMFGNMMRPIEGLTLKANHATTTAMKTTAAGIADGAVKLADFVAAKRQDDVATPKARILAIDQGARSQYNQGTPALNTVEANYYAGVAAFDADIAKKLNNVSDWRTQTALQAILMEPDEGASIALVRKYMASGDGPLNAAWMQAGALLPIRSEVVASLTVEYQKTYATELFRRKEAHEEVRQIARTVLDTARNYVEWHLNADTVAEIVRKQDEASRAAVALGLQSVGSV